MGVNKGTAIFFDSSNFNFMIILIFNLVCYWNFFLNPYPRLDLSSTQQSFCHYLPQLKFLQYPLKR